MTLFQYIENPLGKKNAVFSQRNILRQVYTAKLDAVMLREAGKMKYDLYHNKKDDTYWIHIKVPSEVVPKFYYDVVIKFFTSDNGQRTSGSLADYNVRFFSNDPAFVYTYLRVFLKNGLFIDELKSKAPAKALKEDPSERNPYETPGYVKSLYFAYLYIKSKSLFIKDRYLNEGHPLNIKSLIKDIEHGDMKISERQRLGEEEAKKHRAEKSKAKREADNEHRKTIDAFNQKDANRSTAIKTTQMAGKITKTSKRIGRKPHSEK